MTTFNGGSLGSCIDEERSELRYVMWIAEFSESSNLWTHIALQGPLCSMSVWVSDPFLRLTTRLLIGLVEVLKEKKEKIPINFGLFRIFFYPFKYIDWITLCLCFFSGRAEVVNGSCLVQKFFTFSLGFLIHQRWECHCTFFTFLIQTRKKYIVPTFDVVIKEKKNLFFFSSKGWSKFLSLTRETYKTKRRKGKQIWNLSHDLKSVKVTRWT